jgi:hypothetical protein
LLSGLLRHTGKYFRLPPGFYGLTTIFLLLAFMALARLKLVEALRYTAGRVGQIAGSRPRSRSAHLRIMASIASNPSFSLRSSGWKTALGISSPAAK